MQGICSTFAEDDSRENALNKAREERRERERRLLDSICNRPLHTESAKEVCAKHKQERLRHTGSGNVAFTRGNCKQSHLVWSLFAVTTTTTTAAPPPRATEAKNRSRPNAAKGFFRQLFMRPPSNDIPATEEESVNPAVKGAPIATRSFALFTSTQTAKRRLDACQLYARIAPTTRR